MTKNLKPGDKVSWSSHGRNDAEGTVQKKVTSETKIKGHAVKASDDNPQFIVKSENSGGEAAHKPSALKKK